MCVKMQEAEEDRESFVGRAGEARPFINFSSLVCLQYANTVMYMGSMDTDSMLGGRREGAGRAWNGTSPMSP